MLDNKSIAGFFAGAACIFGVVSVLIMNPEQMWRWVLNKEKVEIKVERALSDPPQIISNYEKKISALQEKFLSQEGDSKKIELALRDDIKGKARKIENLEREIGNQVTQKKELQTQLSATEKRLRLKTSRNVDCSSTDKLSDQFVFTNLELPSNTPKIVYNGQVSMTNISADSHSCSIKIVSFCDTNESQSFSLEKGAPKVLSISGVDYIMHMVGYKANQNTCVVTTFKKVK